MNPLSLLRRERTRSRPEGGVVQFSAQAWRTMLAFRQLRSDQLEAGGISIGRVLRGSSDVVVDVITVPGPRDERRRTAFVRRDSSHQAALDAA